MRRAVLAFGSTVAGLILLLSFRSHTSSNALAGVSAAGTSSGSSAGAAGSGSSGGSGGGSTTGSGASASAPPSAPPGGKVVTGDVINSAYGPSQVAITLSGNKIIKVTVLQHTDDGVNSEQIDGNALPKLTAETLAAQSAKIDAVSGASYTSSGYIKSLQSALDKASA